VTGRTDSQGQLEELERANLLVVPLDDVRDAPWSRWKNQRAAMDVKERQASMSLPVDRSGD